jgi:hypothetical protein
MNLLKVIVDRSKWNGNTLKPVEESRLYDPNTNKMCCLGFACLAAGLNEGAISGSSYVHDIKPFMSIPAALLWLVEYPEDELLGESVISRILTEANDNHKAPFRTLTEKENYLIENGRKAGIEFEFVDSLALVKG